MAQLVHIVLASLKIAESDRLRGSAPAAPAGANSRKKKVQKNGNFYKVCDFFLKLMQCINFFENTALLDKVIENMQMSCYPDIIL